MIQTRMTWQGGLTFEATGEFGHRIVTGASRKAGGDEQGHKPTELLMWGIASCTGIDVVRILEKKRQNLTSLEIEIVGHQQVEYPRPFHTIEIKYIARGKNLDKNKLAQAIELSQSKYCIVSQTVINTTNIKTSFEVQSD